MRDPAEVLELLRAILLEHMNRQGALPCHRVQSAVYIGLRSGRPISDIDDDLISGRDALGGLRLTMLDGSEYDLTLQRAKGLEA